MCVAGALLLSYHYRFHFDRIPIPGTEPPSFRRYVQAIPFAIVLMWISLTGTRSYSQQRGRALIDEIYGLIGGVAIGAVLLLAAMSLYRDFPYSRLVVVYMAVAAAVLLIVFRALVRGVLGRLRRFGIGITRALVVGSGSGAEALIHRLEMFPQYGYRLVGVVDNELDVGSDYKGLRVMGEESQLPALIRDSGAGVVFIASANPDQRRITRLIALCDETGAEFKLLPQILEVITSGVVADEIEGLPLVGVRQPNLRGVNLLLKRAFDLALSLVLLIPGIPLMAITAVAVKIDSPGPIIYRQERVGRKQRTFTAYKFRSMVRDAEADTGPMMTERDDPRITRVGRFIRRTGLDEIPQILNVLKGEMSLVGPRPERPHFVEQFESEVPGYVQRHEAPPGITGWAQLNDLRQETPIDQRTIYDLYYLENWSLAFDVKILALTFLRVLFHRNAY